MQQRWWLGRISIPWKQERLVAEDALEENELFGQVPQHVLRKLMAGSKPNSPCYWCKMTCQFLS